MRRVEAVGRPFNGISRGNELSRRAFVTRGFAVGAPARVDRALSAAQDSFAHVNGVRTHYPGTEDSRAVILVVAFVRHRLGVTSFAYVDGGLPLG